MEVVGLRIPLHLMTMTMAKSINPKLNKSKKLVNFLSALILFQFIFCACDGFNWYVEIDLNDCDENDISVINFIILQSKKTIEWDMDVNFNGEIEALEVGWQFWEEGRLIHWICADVPSPWYVYNYDCGLSGSFPDELIKLEKLEKLHFDNNNFMGIISNSLCEMKVTQKSDYWFRIKDNKLCPPYPDCIEGTNLIQRKSDCYEKK